MLFTIHPLPIVDLLLFGLTPTGLAQQYSCPMLPAPFELPPILQVLFAEIVYSIALNPLSPPCAYVHISVGECVLPLDQLSAFIVHLGSFHRITEERLQGLKRSWLQLGVLPFEPFGWLVVGRGPCLSYTSTFPIFILLPTAVILDTGHLPGALGCCFPATIILQSLRRLALPPCAIHQFFLREFVIFLPLDDVVGRVLVVVEGLEGCVGEYDLLWAQLGDDG